MVGIAILTDKDPSHIEVVVSKSCLGEGAPMSNVDVLQTDVQEKIQEMVRRIVVGFNAQNLNKGSVICLRAFPSICFATIVPEIFKSE